MNYYNEIDKKAAAWLRELIKKDCIPNGEVDTRSITEIKPSELAGYTQCHFFAGIGGWSYALELAGWPSDRPVWTGSCPCQPFSTAGKQKAQEDERHLWPAFHALIKECRPEFVFGEQVANAIGHGWLDGISSDLEAENYTCGSVVLGAHSVGAPHIRQRLYWMAHDNNQHERPAKQHRARTSNPTWRGEADGAGNSRRLTNERRRGSGNVERKAIEEQGKTQEREWRRNANINSGQDHNRLGQSNCGGRITRGDATSTMGFRSSAVSTGSWSGSTGIECLDGKLRRIPTEPAFSPLAHGIPARVVRLRGYGNAIVPQVAAAFIEACGIVMDDWAA